MTQLFGIPLDKLSSILLVTTLIIIVGVVLLALSNLVFFKIGVRNIPRRRVQMLLIVFALMLSTTLLSSVLATGDVITAAVQSVAVYNLGNVDETIEGGQGGLGFFDDRVYYTVREHAKHDPDIATVGAALVEHDLLVADITSRQVRSKVTALAIIPGSEQGFGGMQNDNGKGHLRIADLAPNEVYVNHTTAMLLNAHAGDDLYLYSKRWPGRRYQFHVRAIVADGGLAGEKLYILSQVSAFRNIEGRYDDITQIYIANRGGGGVNGVDLSDRVAETLENWIPADVHVNQVKQEGIEFSQKAQDIFSRIFALFCLFALAIGLLLIFLIFVLLAAERRVEMGMARAIGVQRRHLVLTFLFEGTVYDLLASIIGLAFGVGLGALLVIYLDPILARFDFPLKLTFQPRSMIIAYCLGVIFTFCSVAISAWIVSRMTVVDAIRNLPESGRRSLSLREIGTLLLNVGTQFIAPNHQLIAPKKAYKQIPDILIDLIRMLVLSGLVPLVVGYRLVQIGLGDQQITPFSLGLSLIVIGAGLLIQRVVETGLALWNKPRATARVAPTQGRRRDARSQRRPQGSPLPKDEGGRQGGAANRVVARIAPTVAGLAVTAFWALPFDVLAQFGLPRFQGGIEIFFLAGLMMVLGTVWALITNAEVIVRPLVALSSWQPRLRIMSRLASAYPLHHRFRTGLSVVMFSLVVFVMTVMAVITNAMQNTYADINVQTGGYDIQAVAYFKPLPVANGKGGPDLRAILASQGLDPNDFASIGVRTPTVVGVIQPSAEKPAWHIYPAQVVSGGFLQGYGLHLTARAQGFNSDSAVWQALQTHPNYALIDSSALPYRPDSLINSPVYDPNAPTADQANTPVYPPGLDPYYAFSVGGIYQGDTSFSPTPVWVSGLKDPSAIKLTIIGVVDNSDSAHFGLYIPQSAYQSSALALDTSTPEAQTYYFKVAPGQDKRALSLALGSAFLDYGLETTVLEDAVWQLRGPRIFLSDVLLGVVGMTLLLGVAALAITGTRAVLERRQQIGMLRALGCKRLLLQSAFLCESFLVGCVGSLLGVVLGLILSHNIFAANFFEQYQTGLVFAVPWNELEIIVGVALLASLLAALLPAWQAGRVTPIEALRYQ
jgi:putative ABC transport system permease protein